MEQRIDPNTQPGYAAGTDPAFIPGLTAPVTARKPDTSLEQPDLEETEPEQTEPEQTGQEKPKQEKPEQDHPESEAAAVRSADDAAPDGDASDDGDSEAADGRAAADGPSFEVSDRRGSITADRAGVRFRLDDQEADFRWDEIGAVEVKLPRFGRRFTVTVHMSTRRWFNAEVEAPARSSLKGWAAELDAVLDAYFEES
ncbi:hypothetical protein [Streptomyces sp. NBC_00893]|uniref:hypothetical protein n=1 Tax=Streptomyces sp. NBC_00893 TaxID=2975862 RepID=UPI002257FF24|nr:hypothetical protein [Streptomyces sp. NBC_00893]MCX4844571.1 hypothetical protein [Streptomyces sp. NBC_00893]